MGPLNERPGLLSWLPKALACIGLLPFILGFGWLTWTTASESIERSRNWRLVQGRVADASAGEDEASVRFAYDSDGKQAEVLVPRANGLKGVREGEIIPLHINPANPAKAEPARGSDLWATPGIAGFFLVFLTGAFVFLWRVKPMKIEIPREFEEDAFEPEAGRFKPDRSRFARGPEPRDRP